MNIIFDGFTLPVLSAVYIKKADRYCDRLFYGFRTLLLCPGAGARIVCDCSDIHIPVRVSSLYS